MRDKFLSFLFFGLLSLSVFAKEIVIKDVYDREVKLDVPAKRIVVAFYLPDFLAVGGNKAFDNVVGISKDSWASYFPNNYQLFSKIIPKVKELEDIGDPQFGTFSLEKLLSLKSDALVLADWQYDILKDDIPTIEKSGTAVLVVSYNKETLKDHRVSTEVLGYLLGEEERAKEIMKFYEDRLNYLQNKIAKAKLPKPKIYIELGNKGPDENSFTFGSDMWGSLAKAVGGENISEPFVEKWGVINPEQVLVSNPDVIIITGRENELNKNPDAMVMGIDIEEKEALRRLLGFKNRKGYKNLSAVKNNRIYGLYNHLSRGLSDIAGAEFLAKALYPDLFKDLDPQNTYDEFYKKFMPAVPKGTFGIHLEG